jgi:hypothetical protein
VGFPYIEKWYITQGIYEILHQMDNSVLSGHLGKKKTKEIFSQRFFWFEMREDINICGKHLYPFGKIVGNSQIIYIPSRVHWHWSQYISS